MAPQVLAGLWVTRIYGTTGPGRAVGDPEFRRPTGPGSTIMVSPRRFWPEIDDRQRRAVFERRVEVKLLVGCWAHSKAAMFPFLKSLAAMADNSMGYRAQVVSAAR